MQCGECLVFPICKAKVNQYNILTTLYYCDIVRENIGLTKKGSRRKRYHYTNESKYMEIRKSFGLEK